MSNFFYQLIILQEDDTYQIKLENVYYIDYSLNGVCYVIGHEGCNCYEYEAISMWTDKSFWFQCVTKESLKL